MSEILCAENAVAPAAPSAGLVTLYSKTDGKWYYKGSDGIEHALIAPAGAGTGDMLAANNLSDVLNVALARVNLGLGNVGNTLDAALRDTDTHTDGTTNGVYTLAERAKLTAIEIAATADQTGVEIKTAYELLADTNAFTDAEKLKLGNLITGYLGFYTNLAGLQAAHATGVDGQYATLGSTDTHWSWDSNTSAWVNTGTTSLGDMTKAVFDPTSKNTDAFSMTNMSEGAINKVLTATERTNITGNTAKVGITPQQAAAIVLNTGKVSDINHVTVLLPNVNNTSDTAKPVSIAQQTALDGKEASLGNPSVDGYVLSSTIAGVRSWVAQASGGGGGGSQSDIDRNSTNILLNAFRIIVNGNLAMQLMIDGFVDDYIDNLGIKPTAANFVYDGPNSLYTSIAGGNLSLPSVSKTALVQPTSATVTLFEEDIDAVTLNTDLMADVSRDGATWTTVVLVSKNDYYKASGAPVALIPVMTSNILPSGIASASSTVGGNNPAWKAFGNPSGWLSTSGVSTAWLAYEFPTPVVVSSYTIHPFQATFVFEGWNGSAWIALGSEQTIVNTPTTYQIANTTAYIKYRFNFLTRVNNNFIVTSVQMYSTASIPSRILQGTANISAQPAGTSMQMRVRSANGKIFKLHGASLGWK